MNKQARNKTCKSSDTRVYASLRDSVTHPNEEEALTAAPQFTLTHVDYFGQST